MVGGTGQDKMRCMVRAPDPSTSSTRLQSRTRVPSQSLASQPVPLDPLPVMSMMMSCLNTLDA